MVQAFRESLEEAIRIEHEEDAKKARLAQKTLQDHIHRELLSYEATIPGKCRAFIDYNDGDNIFSGIPNNKNEEPNALLKCREHQPKGDVPKCKGVALACATLTEDQSSCEKTWKGCSFENVKTVKDDTTAIYDESTTPNAAVWVEFSETQQVEYNKLLQDELVTQEQEKESPTHAWDLTHESQGQASFGEAA